MLSGGTKNPAEVDQAIPIELQRMDRGPTGRRQAFHPQAILAPSKMVTPSLPSRIIKGNNLARRRIPAADLVVLLVITALTAKRQVIQAVTTTSGSGHYVVHGK
jgi:hypothetical protein